MAAGSRAENAFIRFGLERTHQGTDRPSILHDLGDRDWRSTVAGAARKAAAQGRSYCRVSHAFRKKSELPKLPDFNASVRSVPESARVHGTPGSISGPIASALTPSAPTTAPAVSPPATMKRAKPRSGSAR